MKFESFLENAYFGRLDLSRFHYEETPPDDPLVTRMVSQFKEASRNFPPGMLEKLGRIPPELLDNLRRIGFFGAIIPREYGGLGATNHQYAAAIEELVGVDMAMGILALAHLSIGVMGVILYGNEDQKRRYLPKAASGEMIFCYALTEPLHGSDAQNIETFATLSEDGKFYILNGGKTFITNANYAGGLTVFAQMDSQKPGKLGAFIVETAWEGVTIGPDMEKMGLKASSTAAIQLKNVRVPVENLIGAPGDGFKIAMVILNYGRLALGAASAGMMKISVSDMMKRASARQQFGSPLVSFELIQEKIVRASYHQEIIKAMTHMTAGYLDADPVASVAIESSHCKLFGTNQAWETLYDAMQVAGGSGYLATQPYEKRMRDFRVATIFEGTSEIHSVYPPLSLARSVQKQLKGLSPLASFLHLSGLFLRPSFSVSGGGVPAVRLAVKTAARGALIFRRLFIRAVIHYGRRLPEQEYLLRRMTQISYYVFGLLSLTARVNYLQAGGTDTAYLQAVLGHFAAEAASETRRLARLKPDTAEHQVNGLMAALKKTQEGSTHE